MSSEENIPMWTGTSDSPPLVRPRVRDVRGVNNDRGGINNIIQEAIYVITVLNYSVISGIRIHRDVPGGCTASESVNGGVNRS